ncbi:MAG: hypothetical protein P8Z42_04685 [Anaerolineales bacterium]|jgi:type II secretory pathway pseudopilin PulG
MAEDFEVGGLLPGESSSNRTFVMAAVGLGALLILSMACLAAYALWYAPRQKVAQQTEAAEIVLQNTEVAGTQTAEASGATEAVAPPTEAETATPSPTITPTQVVVLPTNTPTEFLTLGTVEPGTATAAAQATLDAEMGGGGGGTPTATALPVTGFADEVGMPALLLLAGALLAVIFVARGIRTRGEVQD